MNTEGQQCRDQQKMPLLLRLEEGTGYVEIGHDGAVYWVNDKLGVRELLADIDSLCGITNLWATTKDDVFKPACEWHDKAYSHREEFEGWGWNRFDIDEHFYHLMLVIAGDSIELQKRACKFYSIVQCFGWIFYYRQ